MAASPSRLRSLGKEEGMCMHAWVLSFQLCPTLCDPMDCSHRAPLSMGFSSKDTGVGFHALLQGIFPTQGSNPRLLQLLPCRWILYCWVTGEAPEKRAIIFLIHKDGYPQRPCWHPFLSPCQHWVTGPHPNLGWQGGSLAFTSQDLRLEVSSLTITAQPPMTSHYVLSWQQVQMWKGGWWVGTQQCLPHPNPMSLAFPSHNSNNLFTQWP